MGLFPSIPGLDIAETIRTFTTTLNRIDAKLAKLLEIEKARDERERSLRVPDYGNANRALGIGANGLGMPGNSSVQLVPGGGGAGGGGNSHGKGGNTSCGCNQRAAQ